MSSRTHTSRVHHLAQELQHWLWQQMGPKAPSADEVYSFIDEHLNKYGITLDCPDSTNESVKVPALLKSETVNDSTSRRMRELAGIPHKKNFV